MVFGSGVAAFGAGFRYEFQAGSNYVYEVRGRAVEGEMSETLAGRVSYGLKPGAGMVLVGRGKLVREREAGMGLLVPGGAGEVGASLRAGGYRWLEGGGEFAMDAQGRGSRAVVGSRFFGDVSRLVVDPLLPAGKQAWSVVVDCEMVREELVAGRVREVRVPVREQVVYSLGEVGEESVVFTRRYELRTVGEGAGMRLTGVATNRFDLVRGLPLAMSFAGELAEVVEGRERRVGLTVEYRLLEGRELADAAGRGKGVAKAAQGVAKRLTTVEYEALWRDLRGADPLRQRAAVGRLAGYQPAGNRAEVVRVLVGLAGSGEVLLRAAAVKALAVWGTVAEEKVLLAALDDRELPVRMAAMEGVALMGSARGAAALAEMVAAGRDFSQASRALRGMGAVAEGAVVELLERGDVPARREACQMLRVIGSAKSLPVLREAVKDSDSLVALLAREAAKVVANKH